MSARCAVARSEAIYSLFIYGSRPWPLSAAPCILLAPTPPPSQLPPSLPSSQSLAVIPCLLLMLRPPLTLLPHSSDKSTSVCLIYVGCKSSYALLSFPALSLPIINLTSDISPYVIVLYMAMICCLCACVSPPSAVCVAGTMAV